MKTTILAIVLTLATCLLPASDADMALQLVKDEATRQQVELMRSKMAAAVNDSQLRIAERDRLLKSGLLPRPTEPIVREPLVPVVSRVFANTNALPDGWGDHIRAMEKLIPGYGTNFTAQQRALTNAVNKTEVK